MPPLPRVVLAPIDVGRWGGCCPSASVGKAVIGPQRSTDIVPAGQLKLRCTTYSPVGRAPIRGRIAGNGCRGLASLIRLGEVLCSTASRACRVLVYGNPSDCLPAWDEMGRHEMLSLASRTWSLTGRHAASVTTSQLRVLTRADISPVRPVGNAASPLMSRALAPIRPCFELPL